ncbi:MAG TPA: hypothetical protein VFL99_07490 [Segeticoccus sp.]|uniref:hypothetical protein n=1 Tax=Segeticoccus sp. TaxID=2706531 RepID=UPI002D7F6B85|nr:hypothetical protein [Segeticoccus sp.]HET8600152.1 hypothetical protein [Segeticoccus sp.]
MSPLGMALEGARAAYGLSLLRRRNAMDRVLGARLVVQGGGSVWLQQFAREPVVHGCGGVVDALHALSMLGLAAVSRKRRREALHSALVATGFAVGEALVCTLPSLNRPSP